MFDDEDFENEEEMTPGGESFPVDGETSGHQKSNIPLSQLKQKSGSGSEKDGQNLQNTIANNKTKNASSNIARSAGNAMKNGNGAQGDEQEDEQGEGQDGQKGPNVKNAEQQAGTEAAKLAASTAMQAAGVPKGIADKVSEKVLDSEQGQKLINDTIKKFKEQKKKLILKIASAVLPYAISMFAIAFVVVFITTQLMVIVEKVEGAFINISTGVEKFLNLTTGNGWNTEEEAFFITLQDQYEESLKYSENGIDIPLLAATIHYNRIVDSGIYEEDEGGETDTSFEEDSDTEQLFGNFLEAENMKNFYYVANNKLGSLYDFTPGNRKLIGHMVDIKVTMGKYDLGTALQKWGYFFNFYGKSFDETALKNIFKVISPFEISSTITEMLAYGDLDTDADNYFEYYGRNLAYEAKELGELIDNTFGPNGENIDVSGVSEEMFDDGATVDTGDSIPAPNIQLIYNEEKYREYLTEVYVPGTYFSSGVYEDDEVERIVREIFDQRETYYYLVGQDVTSSNFNANNISVTVTNCDGTMVLEQGISLYDYLSGVLYAEGGLYNPTEFLKAQAIALKTYIFKLNGATPSSIPTNLRIKNCQMNQLYCNVSQGCHSLDDGDQIGEKDNRDALMAGADAEGNYKYGPVDASSLAIIKEVIDATIDEFVVNGDTFVTTQYRSKCETITCDMTTNIMDQSVAIQMAKDGSTYQEILNTFYNGEIQEIELSSSSFPLDLVNNTLTSKFGWRNHPISKCCKFHTGIDLSAPGDSNIYSVAPGVVVINANNPSGYGYYVVIGHGEFKDNKYEYYTLYAHQIRMSSTYVGQVVKAGEKIGSVGSTGSSSGNHLHFEVYSLDGGGNKVRRDPEEYLKYELKNSAGAFYVSESACISAGNSKC